MKKILIVVVILAVFGVISWQTIFRGVKSAGRIGINAAKEAVTAAVEVAKEK